MKTKRTNERLGRFDACISLHEAAHAIAAIYLRLKLRAATIRPEGRLDGRVLIEPSTTFRMFSRRGEVYINDSEAKKRRFIEKQIIMAYAGFAADKLSNSSVRWQDVHYSMDRRNVEIARKEGKLSRASLARLMKEAELLVTRPRVQDAIVLTAIQLESAWRSNKELTPSEIRSIYRVSLQTNADDLAAISGCDFVRVANPRAKKI